jgi:hypothetical protein
MSDASATLYLLAALAAVLLASHAVRATRGWWRLRGQRLIICPETKLPAAVALSASSTAAHALSPTSSLRLATCSRWPSRRDCDQACVPQIEAAPDDTLVRNIADRWFAGKTCLYCGQPIAGPPLVAHGAALRGPDGPTFQWTDVRPEYLPQLFRTHSPVCWNCHIAETFRHMHPELVTDRSVGRS